MPTVIGHQDVKGTKHRLASPKREEVFGPLGSRTSGRSWTSRTRPT
jgi:hypothetical protein